MAFAIKREEGSRVPLTFFSKKVFCKKKTFRIIPWLSNVHIVVEVTMNVVHFELKNDNFDWDQVKNPFHKDYLKSW